MTRTSLKPGLAIALGVAAVVGMAGLQVLSLPIAVASSVGPLIIVLSSIYGITAADTVALITAKLSPHLIATLVAVLTAVAGLLPVVHIGVLRVVVGVVIAVGSVLLPSARLPVVTPAPPAGPVQAVTPTVPPAAPTPPPAAPSSSATPPVK